MANLTAPLMPQIQNTGFAPVNAPQVDYSRLFAGGGIIGGLASGIQKGQQMAATKQQMQAREQQMGEQTEEANVQREKDRLDSLARGAQEIAGLPPAQQMQALQARAARLQDNTDTLEAIELLQTDPAAFNETLKIALDYGYRTDLFKTDAEMMAAQNKATYGAQQTFKDENDNLFFGTMRKKTGGEIDTVLSPVTPGTAPQGKLSLVSGLGQTASEKSRLAIEQADKIARLKAEVEAGSAADKEFQKQLGGYRNDIDKEERRQFSMAQKSSATLAELENALEGAETGKYAQAKTFVGRYMPGVDVSDEQNLDALLTQLGIQELMKFSGPTTDFEFLKSMNTLVQTGNTKEANHLIMDRMKRDVGMAMKRNKAYQSYKKDNKEWEKFEEHYGQQLETEEKTKPTGATVRAGALYKEGQTNRDGNMVVKSGWWVPVDQAGEIAPAQSDQPAQAGTPPPPPNDSNIVEWDSL